MTKRIGVSRLHLHDGSVRHNQIVVIEDGKIVRYYPLTEEEAFTSWIGGDFYLDEWTGEKALSMY